MKTIVTLIDFTDVTDKLIKHSRALATAFGSQIILMHIVAPDPPVVSYGADMPLIPLPTSPEILQADKTRLDQLLNSLTQDGFNALALQFNGPVAPTALDEIKQVGADLVIMGSHHHSTFYNFFVGNLTTDILKDAAFPVLVVPSESRGKSAEA